MDYQGNNLREFLQFNGHLMLQRVNNNYNLRCFTEKEIEHITNGYSTLLGKGAFSEVYRGVLDDQHMVAVKKYKDGTRKEDLAKEVIVHSQINHKNVVRLLGCCTEENALAIVMELICNGNLADNLHRSNANSHVSFPLDRRLSIAVELAEVLSYMHSMYSPILHGDIKPDNILLDENHAPKISDFGIARLLTSNETQQTKNVIGSIGYLDPLYSQTGILTLKSDLYSFGVLLVEIITRKKVADGNTNLIQNFNEALKRGKRVRQIFYEEIMNGKTSINVLDDVAKLAAKCLSLEDKQRPEMVEVADRLRKCRKDLQLHRRGAMVEFSGSNYLSMKPPAPTPKQPTQVLAISLDELKEITRNIGYDALVGKGSHSQVFLGKLKDGGKYAVKMLYYPNFAVKELDKEIILQVQSISRLEHDNIVQLLSYCVEGKVRALVYEYSARGSLHDILHGKKGVVGAQPGQALSWAQRVNIALSSAEGLEFIHERAEPRIANRAIKSSNILLFDNDVAKIIIGVIGVFESYPDDMINPDPLYYHSRSHPDLYCYAPEYVATGEFSNKRYIFSFGIVLLELLTGRKGGGQKSLLSWATPILRKGKVHKYADPRLGGEYPPKDVAKMAAIASRCLQYNPGLPAQHQRCRQ
ncbi:unnamed protein product [Urochloa decumbens]|uniref:Protein kinase domain-containing protein n=1 Tax=Urochloa decumbens TaxID=240449 RepID=A0ABC9AEH1_9POAL